MEQFDFSRAVKLLDDAGTVAICGHVNPDGDCLGSALALAAALQERGVAATPLLASRDRPAAYEFLVGYERLVPACEYKETPDVFVALDVPCAERMGDGARVLERAASSVVIDHHQGDGSFADIAYVDAEAPAAGVLVWDFLGQLCDKRSADMADCCYTALVTDTGRFQFQNATERAFSAAAEMVAAGAKPAHIALCVYQNRSLASLELEALVIRRMKFSCDGRMVYSWVNGDDLENLGASKEDGEGLIDVIRQLAGVEVAVMLREQKSVVRGSIRSKSGCDVSLIAAQLGGGGHKAAAGFTIKKPLRAAEREIVSLVAASLAASDGSEQGR